MNPYLPRLSRRDIFRLGAVSVSSYCLAPTLVPHQVRADVDVQPRGGADVCIFLMLKGGPSQLETFDLKEGPWTPEDLAPETVTPGFRMPMGLLPKLAARRDKYSIIRSMEAWEAEHARGVYYIQAGRLFSPARVREIPSVGAIVAFETAQRRRENDYLPPYLSLDLPSADIVGAGCLAGQAAPMAIATTGELPFVVPENERETFQRRRSFLKQIDSNGVFDKRHQQGLFAEIEQQYRLADPLLNNRAAAPVFQLDAKQRERYGKCGVGDACLLARNVIQADAGTRFILISHDGWDLHGSAFDKTAGNNQYTLCRDLDAALSALLDDLHTQRDARGRQLIDRTFLACMGEFGRTPGALTLNKGRDHYRFASVGLFAGAGVRGGQVLGATDETAARVVDPGWHHNRSIYPEDIFATLYSTMGIDWSKRVRETPSGRPFDYIENISPKGYLKFDEVKELFA